MGAMILAISFMLLLSCDEEPANLDCGFSCDDKKIKSWYKKKFGEPINEFELLVTNIDFFHKIDYYGSNRSIHYYGGAKKNSFSMYNFLAVRTVTGAYAEHSDRFGYLRTELNIEEWLTFVRALYKCGFDELGEYHNPDVKTNEKEELKVFSSNKEDRINGKDDGLEWGKLKRVTDSIIEAKTWEMK